MVIFFNANFDLEIHKVKKMRMKPSWFGHYNWRITLINMYGPNVDTPFFYQKKADIIK